MEAGEPAWLEGLRDLDALQHAAQALAVLRAAQSRGLLQRMAAPVGVEELAAVAGVRQQRLAAALGLLAAYGIVEEGPQGWALTPGWSPLVLGQTPLRFEATLGMGRVRAEQFEASLSGGHDYWQLTPQDRMLVAQGISPDPSVDAALAVITDVSTMPGVGDVLDRGGRILELGCGIASRLCAMLRAYPRARGIGLELDAELLHAARAQAEQLDVADRLELVHGDATTYRPQEPVDLVQWSQFFFPEPTRAAALAAARESLRPGGWVSMPAVWPGGAPEAGSAKDRELAAARLLMDLWRVPLRSARDLAEEVRAAGFHDVRIDERPVMCLVRGQRPD